ncbi:MAG: HDOD domain-containing protein, partial [Thermodesulfobacteriota bacterium]
NTEELASLPEVFAKIINTLNDPDTTADSLAEIISYDVNLSAKLIKLVNSPLYGLLQKVDSISRAISLLGLHTVKNLAVNASVMQMFKDLPPDLLDMHAFWEHSIACGVVAQLFWGSSGRKGEEIFFLSGTLHDLGRLIILKEHPEHMRAVLLHPERGKKPLYQLEKKVWGFTHFELGAKLIKSWNFPLIFSDLVKFHHFPKKARYETEAINIHFADIIVHAMELGDSGEKNVPPLQADFEKNLGITLKDLRELLEQIRYLVQHMQKIFFQGDEG